MHLLYKILFNGVRPWLISSLLMAMSISAQACQLNNAALQAMGNASVHFYSSDQELISNKNAFFDVGVRLADTAQTRAAGFQYVCDSVIKETPILFLFQRPIRPSFHMRNVVAPIDIAFIREDGSIDSFYAMKPYVLGSKRKPVYSPRRPVIAALEVAPGFFQNNKISKSTFVAWTNKSQE